MIVKRRVRWIVFAAILTSVLLTGCSGLTGTSDASGAAITLISAQELHSMLESKDFLLLNVHVPYDGEIAETDIHIPFDQLRDFEEMLPDDKDAKIVQYCRSSGMTKTSGQTLLEMGYTNVYELDGGFTAWQIAGYELVHLR